MNERGVTKTYSKKNKSGASTSVALSTFSDITNRDTTASPSTNNLKPKRRYNSDDGQENAKVPILSCSASSNDIESRNSTAEFQKGKTNKRANGIDDIIASGLPEYRKLLNECINKVNGKMNKLELELHNYVFMTLSQIQTKFSQMSGLNLDGFVKWLCDIGFEECLWGDEPLYKLSQTKVNDLKKNLLNFAVSRERSDSFRNNELIRLTPLIIPPLGASPSIFSDGTSGSDRVTPDSYGSSRYNQAPTPGSEMMMEQFGGMKIRGSTPLASGTSGQHVLAFCVSPPNISGSQMNSTSGAPQFACADNGSLIAGGFASYPPMIGASSQSFHPRDEENDPELSTINCGQSKAFFRSGSSCSNTSPLKSRSNSSPQKYQGCSSTRSRSTSSAKTILQLPETMADTYSSEISIDDRVNSGYRPEIPSMTSIVSFGSAVSTEPPTPPPKSVPLAKKPTANKRALSSDKRSKSVNDGKIESNRAGSPARPSSQPNPEVSAYCTPTRHYNYNDTEGASTAEINKFRAGCDTGNSSGKKSNTLSSNLSSRPLFQNRSGIERAKSMSSIGNNSDSGFTVNVDSNPSLFFCAPLAPDVSQRIHSNSYGSSISSGQEPMNEASTTSLFNDSTTLNFIEMNRRGLSRQNNNAGQGYGYCSNNTSAQSAVISSSGYRLSPHHQSGVSSPISFFHSSLHMYAIPESGEDCMESPRQSHNDESQFIEDRDNISLNLKKKQMSDSKKSRLSGKFPSDLSCSSKKLRARRRRATMFVRRNQSDPLLGTNMSSIDLPLTESTFFPIVIGGLFMQEFEFGRPVVEPSIPSGARVIDLRFPSTGVVPMGLSHAVNMWNNSCNVRGIKNELSQEIYYSMGECLELAVYNSALSSPIITISLDSFWFVVPCYPAGLLFVSTYHVCPGDSRKMSFFIPRELQASLLPSGSLSLDHISCRGILPVNRTDSVELFAHEDMAIVDLNVSCATATTELDGEGIDFTCGVMDTSVNSAGNVSKVSDRSDLNSSHHLLSFIHDHYVSPMVNAQGMSPLVSVEDEMDASFQPTEQLMESYPVSEQPVLSTEGNAYFQQLVSDPNEIFAHCLKQDYLKNDIILFKVMEFLYESENYGASTAKSDVRSGRALRRAVSITSAGATDRALTISPNAFSSADVLTGIRAIRAVSKTWAVNWAKFYAHVKANSTYSHQNRSRATSVLRAQYETWCKFMEQFKCGITVGSGGAKTVYRMEPITPLYPHSVEAVSVMSTKDIQNESVMQELIVSKTCSALSTVGICPNVIQMISTFQSPFPVPPDRWSRYADKKPLPGMNSMRLDDYQYTRMEFCAGGDIEDHIRKIKNTQRVSVDEMRLLLFQMCFSLYSCREQTHLRHFDIKLLNFLLGDASILLPSTNNSICGGRLASPRCNKIALRIGFGDQIFRLLLPRSSSPSLVKLADFGTSAIGRVIGQRSITVPQFTTLENTPPEYLLLGSRASSSCFYGDTFCLGLSFFHLLTGSAPYEELMKDVLCPVTVKQKLSQIWMTDNTSDPYHIIRLVMGTLGVDPRAPTEVGQVLQDNVENVLYNTLYRYTVLLGLPEKTLFSASCRASYGDAVINSSQWGSLPLINPVVASITEALDSGMHRTYVKDCKSWNLFSGGNEFITSVRTRLFDLGPDAEHLLRSMLSYDPQQRCTMHDALTSKVFESLIENSETLHMNQRGEGIPVSFMHYSRATEHGGARCLPYV